MDSPPLQGPYREPGQASPDEEVLALACLVARAARVRRLVAAPILAAGVALAVGAYLAARSSIFEGIDGRAPYFIVMVTALPVVVLAQALAAYAGRVAVMRRSAAWIEEITKPGASPALLEAFVRSL